MTNFNRGCSGTNKKGQPCGATVMEDSSLCFFHNPETQQEAAEARRRSGERRKREGVVSGAYDVEGLDTVADVRRLVEIAILDTLLLDNSVQRNRALGALAQTMLNTVESDELETRLAQLEATLTPRIMRRPS